MARPVNQGLLAQLTNAVSSLAVQGLLLEIMEELTSGPQRLIKKSGQAVSLLNDFVPAASRLCDARNR